MGCTPHSLVQSWESSSDVLQINQHLILNMADGLVEGESRMKIICINCEKKCNGTAGFLRGPTLNFKSPAASSEQPGALWLMACER